MVMTNGATLLRAWRERRAMKQTDVAELAQCDSTQISRLECGAQRPSLLLAIRLARVSGGAVPEESWAQEVRE